MLLRRFLQALLSPQRLKGTCKEAKVATVFDRETLKTIADFYKTSTHYADILGIDPFLAIGGPAEELYTINNYDLAHKAGNAFFDSWVGGFPDWIRDWKGRPIKYSHEDILKNIVESELVDQTNGVSYGQKLDNPVLVDLGMGNFKLGTAIDLLRNYNKKYPITDPFDLKRYNGDLDDLAWDLSTQSNLVTTAKFSVLMAEEAIKFFERRAPTTWENADLFEKLGLVTTYYNRGREKMNKVAGYAERIGEYRPVPGFGGEKAAENGWALASAVGRDLPFSPTSLGAARRADRVSMPGYSGDRGPLRDIRDTAAYGDWGDGRDSSDIGGRGPSPFDNSSVGSGRGNGRSSSSRRGNYRGGGADRNADDRGLNPIQNRREYERRSQAEPSRVPGGLLGREVPVGRISSARLPGQYGTIPIGSETNALDVLGEGGSFRSFPSRPRPDPNADYRGAIRNRYGYERRSQTAPARIPGGLPGPASTRFADSTGGLAPDAGFSVPAGVDLSGLVTGSGPAGRGRRSTKQDRLGRLGDLPAGVMSRMAAAASRVPVGGLMAGWFADQEPPAAREYGLSPSARRGVMPDMSIFFDQRYGLPDPGTAALLSNPNHRAGAAAAPAATARVGGLLGKTVNRLGLYAHQHLQEMQRTALAGEEKTIAARTHGRVPSPRRQQGPVALGAFPPAPPQPTELGALRARSPAALRNASVGGLLGPYFAGLGRGLLGPSASSGQPGSSPYGVGFGLAGMSAAIGGQRGATAFSRSNPGTSYTSLRPNLGGLRRSEKFGWTEVVGPDGAVRGISYDNPGRPSTGSGQALSTGSGGKRKSDKDKKSDKSRYRGARLY